MARSPSRSTSKSPSRQKYYKSVGNSDFYEPTVQDIVLWSTVVLCLAGSVLSIVFAYQLNKNINSDKQDYPWQVLMLLGSIAIAASLLVLFLHYSDWSRSVTGRNMTNWIFLMAVLAVVIAIHNAVAIYWAWKFWHDDRNATIDGSRISSNLIWANIITNSLSFIGWFVYILVLSVY